MKSGSFFMCHAPENAFPREFGVRHNRANDTRPPDYPFKATGGSMATSLFAIDAMAMAARLFEFQGGMRNPRFGQAAF